MCEDPFPEDRKRLGETPLFVNDDIRFLDPSDFSRQPELKPENKQKRRKLILPEDP